MDTINTPTEGRRASPLTQRELSPLQINAVEYLARGAGTQEASRHFGVHRNTVSRWLGDASFQLALGNAVERTTAREQALLQLAREQSLASPEVVAAAMQRNNSAAVRLRAATLVFKHITALAPPPIPPVAFSKIPKNAPFCTTGR